VPFSPLPESLLNRLRQLAGQSSPVVVDLGCGEGALGGLLAEVGVSVLGLDRIPPWAGSEGDVVGDAQYPPFLPGRADLVLAGNLLRHLLVLDPGAGFLVSWRELLRPGGWLILLEDEPGDDSPGRKNYADLQVFLETLTQGRRGRLLPLAEFQKIAARVPARGSWSWGLKTNQWPADAQVAARMLRGTGRSPDGEAGRLIKSIGTHGLDYGDYWWALWERDERE
jgi:SAM-dependent methyltransferase